MQILTMLFYSYFSAKLLIQHGDIESNPGPSKKNRPLTCLTALKMLKKSSIKAYATNHKYDIICITENYLDSVN